LENRSYWNLAFVGDSGLEILFTATKKYILLRLKDLTKVLIQLGCNPAESNNNNYYYYSIAIYFRGPNFQRYGNNAQRYA